MRSWHPPDVYKPIPRNVLLYDGPSLLTGAPILVIASAQNGNRKIGRMLQLWILPAISPIVAVKTGQDTAVCGRCPHRGDGAGNRRTCYVEYFRAVENIWQARAKARVLTPQAFAERHRGLQLRIGAYGDPVAVPRTVWDPLLATAAGWTAYSHAWRLADPAFRTWCMASVDSPAEQLEAARLGWRTFRVRPDGAPPLINEIVCPHEQHDVVKCADCSLCRGGSRQAKHIVVTIHGISGRKYFPSAPVDLAPRLIPMRAIRG